MSHPHPIGEYRRWPDPSRQTELGRLGDEITELAAHIHAATFQLLELIGEFNERGGWEMEGCNSCAHWLNWKCGMNAGAAREKVRVARALPELPKISAAFSEGRISYSKVRAMTRVATRKNEDYLLMIARHGTAAHVERLVGNYRRLKRFEALEAENRRHAHRELSWFRDEDDMWIFKGRFSPEQGALIASALERAMAEMFEEQKREPTDVSAETPPGVDPHQPLPEPVATRRADALERVAEEYLAQAETSRCGHRRSGGDRYMVHIHTEVDTLKSNGTGAESELEGGSNVSAETSRRMACDASAVQWRETPAGEPLSVGRRTRTIPPAIRRALKRRDGGCRFPGCTCERFVDAHHIRHWADGGETSMDNLVLLCRRHHRLMHEGGFGIQSEPSGKIEFTYPDGRTMPAGPDGRFRGNACVIKRNNRANGLEITSETLPSLWTGERMDHDLAILGMISLE